MNTDMNYLAFQKSISAELGAAKNRVRNVIGSNHWGEDGRYKEVILMQYLKSRLPKTVSVGTGFIVTANDISTQTDIIVYRNDIPVILQQGDFVIVPAECVLAVIEVKTSLNKCKLKDAINKSAQINRLFGGRKIFNGIFAFENQIYWRRDGIPSYVEDSLKQCSGNVNYICLGKNYFAKAWDAYQPNLSCENPHYSFYRIMNLSFGYFISNLIEDIYCSLSEQNLPYSLRDMFYPIEGSKENRRFHDFKL